MSGRRGNREGTVYQHSTGRWVAEDRWVDPNTGQTGRKSSTHDTESAARKAARTLEREANANIAPGDRSVTVEGYWEQWRHGPLLSADRKASTVEPYTGIMRVHVLPAVGKVRLPRLTAGHVERMLDGMRRQQDSRHGKAGEPCRGRPGAPRTPCSASCWRPRCATESPARTCATKSTVPRSTPLRPST